MHLYFPQMRGKRVRFKDLGSEPNHAASIGNNACSAPCDARDDLLMRAAVLNEAKTSEFAFFKKLKQDVGRTSCVNLVNRESIPVKNFGPSNHSRELGNSKLKDVKYSKYVKNSTAGEIGSFVSPRDAVLASSDMAGKEHDNGRFKCLSLLETPKCIGIDNFRSTTANASANPESQINDEDIFLSKRMKLRQRITKTLFPETDQVPMECNLVFRLLSRLLPESSQENLSQNAPLRQPETTEKCQLHLDLDLNIQLKEPDMDYFLDSGVSAAQSHRFQDTLPSDKENDDASAARCAYKILLWHKEENDEKSFLNGRNLLTWGNEISDYSIPVSTSPNILDNKTFKHSSCDAYDYGQSGRYRDQSHSYEVCKGSYDSVTPTKRSGILFKDEILDNYLGRGAPSSLSSWYDSCSRVSSETFIPSTLSYLRDCTEANHMNDAKNRRVSQPILLGWDANELDMHDSTHSSLMELEIYRPPSSTSCEDHRDSTELCLPATVCEDYWDSLECRTSLQMSPYIYEACDTQGDHLLQKDLVPRSPCIPFMLSCVPGHLNPDDPGLYVNASRGSSFFFIPEMSHHSLENMICERKLPAVESFLIPQDFESELKCKSLIGFLKESNDVFRQGNPSSQLLIANEENLSISQPEHWSFRSPHIPVSQEVSFPLQLDTVRWKDTDGETYDDDRAITTRDNLFW